MCEAIRGMIAKGREEGIKEGRAEGQKEKAYTTAKNMYSRGFTAEDTAGLLEESMETVVKWFEEWNAGQR